MVGFAQDQAAGAQEPQAGGGRGGRPVEPEIKPYERVITREAKSDEGVPSRKEGSRRP
jgi:hypothetical protein